MHSQLKSMSSRSSKHSLRQTSRLRSRLRSPKLLLLSLVSMAMLTGPSMAEGGALVDSVPQDYTIGEIVDLSDEEYAKLPLTDRD